MGTRNPGTVAYWLRSYSASKRRELSVALVRQILNARRVRAKRSCRLYHGFHDEQRVAGIQDRVTNGDHVESWNGRDGLAPRRVEPLRMDGAGRQQCRRHAGGQA